MKLRMEQLEAMLKERRTRPRSKPPTEAEDTALFDWHADRVFAGWERWGRKKPEPEAPF